MIKVYDFINHETKEENTHSISIILPQNVLLEIKAILIPYSPIEDRIRVGFLSKWRVYS